MLSDFQKKKLTKLFKLYDQNGDGAIYKEDFDKIAENFVKLGICEKDSDDYLTVQFVIHGLWESIDMLTDRNHDGTITLSEFLTSFDKLFEHKESFLPAWLKAAEVTLELTDSNDDRVLTREELIANLQAFHMSLEEAEAAFVHLDRNGHRYLTIDEWKQNIEEFFFSNDPDASGNWLVGVLD